jgi:adenosylcobinamide-phosphate synthase
MAALLPAGAEAMVAAAAVVLALPADRLFGEPPARLHPVVWIGWYLGWVGLRVAPAASVMQSGVDLRSLVKGLLAWTLGAAVVVVAMLGLQALLAAAPSWLAIVGTGLLLKPLLAWRMLREEVGSVESALSHSLASGRERLARLVSRDVSGLTAPEVRESAVETLAENLNDSVVAPLFWFAFAGLPGAALYRFANTADAMWGYRGLRQGRYWEWAGKAAARADDLLSWLPARLTALALAIAAGGLSWTALRHEAARTPSPNAGWPMAAMALALDVRLGKPGVYVLHPHARSPAAEDMAHACRLAARALGLLATGLVLALLGAAHG